MTQIPNQDHDNDNANANANANDKNVPAQAASALASVSLAALVTALSSVDTASVAGRSGLPMLTFKRDGSGTWMYGRRRTVVEDGSRWAVNPLTFKWGYICFGEGNKVIGERLVSISLPKPKVTDLPNMGFPWQEQWSVNLKCIDGADAGTEVVYKPTTVGGIQSIAGLIEAVRDQLNSGQHGGKISPIVLLGKDSYPHPEYGRTWIPLLTIVDWMSPEGPAPAPAPTESSPVSPPSAEQPRRRRVA
jgi:hypothetical protein